MPCVLAVGQEAPARRSLPPPGRLMHDVSMHRISPSAVMTGATRYDHNNVHTLALVVIWKGTEGWYSRGSLGNSSGGAAEQRFGYTVRDGGLALKVHFDAVKRIVEIQGRKQALRDANVVLVDGVDSLSSPTVVGTLRIDPKVATAPDGFPVVEEVWTRSPDIVSFVTR